MRRMMSFISATVDLFSLASLCSIKCCG